MKFPSEEQVVNVARALIMQTSGLSEVKEIDTELRSLQRIVGGDIECVTLETCHLYVDEDGRFKRLELNLAATLFAHRLGWPRGDVLCGPALFLGNDPAGEEANVPDSVLDVLAEMLESSKGVAWETWSARATRQVSKRGDDNR